MTFKERYQSGLCDLSAIESCITQWEQAKDCKISLREYLGLTDFEYAAFLQDGQGDNFRRMMDSGRVCQQFRIYQLDLQPGKTVPFAFSGIEALHKAGYEQPPASEYCLVYEGRMTRPKTQTSSRCWSGSSRTTTMTCPQTTTAAAFPSQMWWNCMMMRGDPTITVIPPALSRSNFHLFWHKRAFTPTQKSAMGLSKVGQLEALLSYCTCLDLKIHYHPEDRYFTAIAWRPDHIFPPEEDAGAIQRQIQRKSAQYPGSCATASTHSAHWSMRYECQKQRNVCAAQ